MADATTSDKEFVAFRDGLTGVFNAGYGGQITILELAQRIVALTRSRSPIEFAAPRAGDVRRSRASIERLCEAGWKPAGSLEQGLAAYAQFLAASEPA